MNRNILFLPALFSGLLIVAACNNGNNDKRRSFADVVEYNDFVVDQVNGLDSAYVLSVDTEQGIDVCMRKCDSLVELCNHATEELMGIQPFEGDSSLTMQALKYVQFMRNNGEHEVKKLLKMIEAYQQMDYDADPEKEEQTLADIDKAADLLDERYEKEINRLEAVQTKLSQKHDFRVLK
ncbi:hypothetical protein [Fluviicola sp.]|uniref:LIC11966 family surface protein n=1 Tax=Fluviicola sp. TaxID=1917219 RepID=UPI0031CE3F0B